MGQHDLEQPYFAAGCKALGLSCKQVTTPLWHLIEDKNTNILDMNDRYLRLVEYLQEAAKDPLSFNSGKLQLYPEVRVKEDDIHSAKEVPKHKFKLK